jgi:hypothetical protein
MLTLLPLGSEAQPQSPLGIHLTAVLAAASVGNMPELILSTSLYGQQEYNTLKQFTNEICLFGIRGVNRVTLASLRKRFVGDDLRRVVFYARKS